MTMTVADLIAKLTTLPPELPVLSTENGHWGEPEIEVVEPGQVFEGIRFEHRTVII